MLTSTNMSLDCYHYPLQVRFKCCFLNSMVNIAASDPLACLLIEEEDPTETIDLNKLHNMPIVWRYRSQITISHLSRTFLAQAPKDAFMILRIFLDEVIPRLDIILSYNLRY